MKLKQTKKVAATVAALALCMTTLVACGGDKDKNEVVLPASEPAISSEVIEEVAPESAVEEVTDVVVSDEAAVEGEDLATDEAASETVEEVTSEADATAETLDAINVEETVTTI